MEYSMIMVSTPASKLVMPSFVLSKPVINPARLPATNSNQQYTKRIDAGSDEEERSDSSPGYEASVYGKIGELQNTVCEKDPPMPQSRRRILVQLRERAN